MLDGCLYHLLDSLLPPLATDGSSQIFMNEDDVGNNVKVGSQDFLRLEFLSACKIMQDMDTALQILPIIPHRFYPALFQAIIQKSFYDALAIKKKHMAATSSIGALVINWPYKTMVLRDLVPPLPSPTTKPYRMTLQVVQVRLNKFFVDVLQLIPHTFIKSKSRKITEIETPLCKLDISGYYGHVSGLIDLALLKKYVTLAYNSISPPHHVKSEMVMDAKLDGEALEELNSLSVICKLSCQHGAGLVVRFRRVHIMSLPIIYIVPITELLAVNGTECLELEMCGLDDERVISVLRMSKSLSSLGLAYNPFISSLEFLSKLPHLCQLDLSGIYLRGKCEGLNGVISGLEYLRMVGCSLKSEDLEVLSATKHVLSLRHLDLSENFFGLPRDFSSFCKLCETLHRVSVLEVENCNLNRATPKMVAELVHILVQMPNLALLRMTRNDFPSWVILSHLVGLRNSSTLRCLCLTTPSDKYLSDDYTVIDRDIQELHTNFIHSLHATKSTHLSVDWSEESSYSHWFYSV